MKSKMNKAMSQRKQRGALGDEWETPWPVFHFIEKQLGVKFTMDVCATKENTKCNAFMSRDYARDVVQWSWHNDECRWPKVKPHKCFAFCNPPYSNISGWLDVAERSARLENIYTVVLIKADTGTKWFLKYAPLAYEIAFLIPRVNYIPPLGVNAPGVSHGSMVLVFKPGRKKNHKPEMHFWKWK